MASTTNIFWLGGTGANVAMAFARMQYLGLIPDLPLRHFFIDSPENFGPATETGREDINIGVDELKRLRLGEWSEPHTVPLTQTSYQTFQQFLAGKPRLKAFYEGMPDYDKILNTPVKDGNYYMPAIAAAMAHAEFVPPDGKLDGNNSIICASSYGGTGAGVAPFLAKHLLNKDHDVKVIYLNHWLVNPAQFDVERITRHNEKANIDYMEKLKKNAINNRRAGQLNWFLFYVTEEWRQKTPPNKPNNTSIEIANPFPYYVANQISRLSSGDGAGGSGGEFKDGSYRLNIDPKRIVKNRAFTHAYAHARLAANCDKEITHSFAFVLELMEAGSDAPHWGLRRLAWDKTAFERLREIEYSSDGGRKEEIRSQIEKENRGSGEGKRKHQLDWTGFRVSEFSTSPLNEPIRFVSYPSLFAAYHYFRDRLENDAACQEAYLALIALVATKQVYVEYDSFVERNGFERESNAMPFKLVDAEGLTLGYAAERGVYLWPLYERIPELRDRLARENLLRRALQQIYERQSAGGSGGTPWQIDSTLGRALTNWGTTHGAAMSTGRGVFLTLTFFEELYFSGSKENIVPARYQPSRMDSQDGGITGQIIFRQEGDGFSVAVSGRDHQLFVLGDRLLQYVNVLRPGNDRRMPRNGKLQRYLILNYRTLVDLSEVSSPSGDQYQVEILHPRHIFADYAFEFPLVESSARARTFVPWPLRKEYIGCLEPENGWHAGGKVNYPIANNGFVDMRPHRIRNWGYVEEMDPLNKDIFLIPLKSVIPLNDASLDNAPAGKVGRSKTSYQGYVWPCDAQSKRFPSGWKFYSIMVTCSPNGRLLATEAAGATEHWSFRHELDGWQDLPGMPSAPGTFIGTCLGGPPEALAFEFTDPAQDSYYGGYFPLPPAEAPSRTELQGVIGIDFGTSNTCSAISSAITEIENIRMNPSELLYPVFSDREWERLKDLSFGWVPWFGFDRPGVRYGGSAEIFPSGLHSLRLEEWEQVRLALGDDRELLFPFTDRPRWPLESFTIPGECMNNSIRNASEYTRYNIKWAGEEKNRIVLWKDFFTTYLLFLAAHLAMGRQFPQNRCATLDINATMPMRFRQSDELRLNELVSFENLGEAFEKVVRAAIQEVQGYTGLTLNYGDTFYESIASSQSLSNRLMEDEVFVVVDVGGGTTDVAVLNGLECLSNSSFVFAGNNPFGRVFGKEYIQKQLNIWETSNPMGGKSSLLSTFIRTLANYTALLVGAAIKQTGLDWTRGDKLKLSVCLFGQAWHLAKFHPDVKEHKDLQRKYRTGIIMREILAAFNDRVRPKLLGKDFPALGENNIIIGNDAIDSKTSCCRGTINAISVKNVDQASEITFLGLSYRAVDKAVSWHERDSTVRIPSYENIEADSLSPGLMVSRETLDERLINNGQWSSLSSLGGPFRDRYIQRNYLEYFLEAEVGGFTRIDITNPVTFHEELLEWGDGGAVDASEDKRIAATGEGVTESDKNS